MNDDGTFNTTPQVIPLLIEKTGNGQTKYIKAISDIDPDTEADDSVNPGASGGVVVDAQGQVIGATINSTPRKSGSESFLYQCTDPNDTETAIYDQKFLDEGTYTPFIPRGRATNAILEDLSRNITVQLDIINNDECLTDDGLVTTTIRLATPGIDS